MCALGFCALWQLYLEVTLAATRNEQLGGRYTVNFQDVVSILAYRLIDQETSRGYAFGKNMGGGE